MPEITRKTLASYDNGLRNRLDVAYRVASPWPVHPSVWDASGSAAFATNQMVSCSRQCAYVAVRRGTALPSLAAGEKEDAGVAEAACIAWPLLLQA